jgi:hypothetical protein
MTLLSIIRDHAEVRDGLRSRVIKPRLSLETLRAPPLTKNYQIVGTAFDYLLRFFLQRLNPDAQSRSWVAEGAVDLIAEDYFLNSNTTHFGTTKLPKRVRHHQKLASNYLKQCMVEYRVYLKSGVVTDKLLASTLRLACLDVALRAGAERIDWRALRYPCLADCADLRALLTLVDETSFRTTCACLLNPFFGAGELVGGADADLLLDDCLIEIKTTKNPYLDVRDFWQLVGYYLLNDLGGMCCATRRAKFYTVNYLAIYYSRFGVLWKIPVADIFPAGSIKETAKWFCETVCPSPSVRRKFLKASFARNTTQNRT